MVTLMSRICPADERMATTLPGPFLTAGDLDNIAAADGAIAATSVASILDSLSRDNFYFSYLIDI